jgi:uncharacterized protein YbjQ (UPF0145 family)
LEETMRMLGVVSVLLLISAARPAYGRDDHLMFPIADALASPDATKLDPGIKLFFGKARPAVARSMGTWTTNKKANAFGRADKQACERAFASAMISLQKRARAEGGDAVIGITSYYKKIVTVSDTEYMCGAGAIMAGVAFRGEVVRLH